MIEKNNRQTHNLEIAPCVSVPRRSLYSEKVLATVASTLYIFMEKFPDAMVFATGSTKARTRLYRIGISNNLAEIQEDFEVFGLVGDSWLPFQKQMEFDAFLVIKKKK